MVSLRKLDDVKLISEIIKIIVITDTEFQKQIGNEKTQNNV